MVRTCKLDKLACIRSARAATPCSRSAVNPDTTAPENGRAQHERLHRSWVSGSTRVRIIRLPEYQTMRAGEFCDRRGRWQALPSLRILHRPVLQVCAYLHQIKAPESIRGVSAGALLPPGGSKGVSAIRIPGREAAWAVWVVGCARCKLSLQHRPM